MSSIRFAAVGDVSLGDHPLCVGFGAYSRFKTRSPLFPFEKVMGELGRADLLFGNLETVLSQRNVETNSFGSVQMRGCPSFVEGIVGAGFKVMNLANNHTMQHGKEPFRETAELLTKHGIGCCGTDLKDDGVGRPVVVEIAKQRIGFLGYSLRPRKYFVYEPLYLEGNLACMKRDIARAKGEVDNVIVSLHWGDEFVQRPSPEEIAVARELIDSGATIIVGHHPHVLRGIESYKHGVIIYSLGNFVFDMIWDKYLRESMIFTCRISRAGIENVELIPIYINNSYQPEVMNEKDGRTLLRRIDELSRVLTQETVTPSEDRRLDYVRESEDLLRKYRRRSRVHFLANLHKYPIPILLQQMTTFVRNRTIGRFDVACSI